jgi:HAD superfamily hydrolase (TIGR01509 family)
MQRQKLRPVFIFDVGGVLLIWPNNDPIFRYIAKRYDIPFAQARRVMNELLPELERGSITCDQFVKKSLASFGKKLRRKDDPARLITVPFSRAKLRKGVVAIIKRLQKKGYEVDGFSNTNLVHEAFMKRMRWTTIFIKFYVSSRLRVLKPAVEAYQKVLYKIGVKGKDAVFVDNMKSNVLGARRAGIKNSFWFHSVRGLWNKIKAVLSTHFSQKVEVKKREFLF